MVSYLGSPAGSATWALNRASSWFSAGTRFLRTARSAVAIARATDWDLAAPWPTTLTPSTPSSGPPPYTSATLPRSYISLVTLSVFLTRGSALMSLYPLLGKERFDLSPVQLGLLFTVPAAANLLCLTFAGALADRVGRKALIVPTAFFFAASLVLAAVSPVLGVFR